MTQHLDPNFVGMITYLENPTVEAWKLNLGTTVRESRAFVHDFMENLDGPIRNHPDGTPQLLVFDPSQPLCGFSSLGPEGIDSIPDSGARRPRARRTSSSSKRAKRRPSTAAPRT